MSDFSQLLEEYAQIREHIDGEEAKLKPLKDVRDKIQQALLAKMNELGMSSAKSQAGHAVNTVTSTTAKVVDREAFLDFVFDNGDDTFLTNHVSKDAVAEYIKQHNGDLPPGIASEQVITLRFTKAKN